MKRAPAVATALAAAVLLAFSPLREAGFLNLDDDKMLTLNSQVNSGLSAAGVRWALSTFTGGNWHPLTWFSHQLDWTLFGGKPLGHHLTNVLLHAVNALLLLGLLLRCTGHLWRSAFVAALFALHPLHVESVAWLAERKDLLCGFFWMLSLWAYRHWVAQPAATRYAPLLVLFALSLMAKPMAVTFPFVLLLLDFWPLGRGAAGWRRLLGEKAPLFALSAAASALTVVAQRSVGAREFGATLTLADRTGNAVLSVGEYLRQTFWPAGLSVFYPHSGSVSPATALVGTAFVGFSCLTVLALRRRVPHAPVGWFWFLGTLVPVLGLVQVGMQSRADRYTYLPLIGVFIALSWAAASVLRGRWQAGAAAGFAAVLLLATLGILAFRQAGRWRNDITLLEHAVVVTGGSAVAHNNLGSAYLVAGRTTDARAQFEAALSLSPGHYSSLANLGLVLLREGRPEEAARHFRSLLGVKPMDALLHLSLGDALSQLGRYGEAARSYRTALSLAPGNAKARTNLAEAEARARAERR